MPASFARTKRNSIWLHAVSAGEAASAIPLIRELRAEDALIPVYLSVGTPAGRQTAERQASAYVNGIFYAPLDYASCIRRVLRVIRPSLLVVLETEIWPNLYVEVKRSGRGLVIVNGRISHQSWPRYEKAKWLLEPVLQLPDRIFVQSSIDRERYARLGAAGSRLMTAGNLKYDAATTAREPLPLPTFGAEQIWIAASTAGPNERGSVQESAIDEDDVVLNTFRVLAAEFPRLLLILAPRQPSRFDAVAEKLERAGLRFLRRTALVREPSLHLELPGVLLLDTIGELSRIYALADVVFVGGSIAPRGGHNIIEPAAAGKAVVIGPHMQNFESIVEDFRKARAVVQIQEASALAEAVRDLLRDREKAREIGLRARSVVEEHRGAAARLARDLWQIYYGASPRPPRGALSHLMLAGLAALWREGGKIKRRRAEHHARSLAPLPAAVISVGGITMGGSGKTPFTNFLAQQLHARGYPTGILMRGYRRRTPAKYLALAPGAKIPAAFTGDEAQIYLRTGISPVGIGANRYQTAQILLRQFPSTRVLLLDDGFQHAGLMRDLDIVLIDGLDPFGQEAIFPLGRLREPLEALSRADVFVVTRVASELQFQAICKRLKEYNRRAPFFRMQIRARYWRDYLTGACLEELPARRVGAFCGLGNPETFCRTLESLGLEVVYQWYFEDHHHYKPFELQRIAHQARAHGAEILVTTEKDRVNCPPHLSKIIAPLDLAWLEIDVQLDEQEEFFSLIEAKIWRAEVRR